MFMKFKLNFRVFVICICLAFSTVNVVSSVCRVQCLLCLVFVMSSVCYVQCLLCPVFVMSSVCYVQCLLCPVFVCLGFVASSVCLSRVSCYT